MHALLCALDAASATLARKALSQGAHHVAAVRDVAAALTSAKHEVPDLVVVGSSSELRVSEACGALRATGFYGSSVLVAVVADGDEVRALNEGADDVLLISADEAATVARLLVSARAATRIALARADLDDRSRFFEMSVDPAWIAGGDGFLRTANAACTVVLGWSNRELLSHPWSSFVHPRDQESTSKAQRQLAEGHSVKGLSTRFRCKDDSYRWLDWSCAPAVGRDVYYCLATDITELRTAAEALEALSSNLAITLDSIGDGVIAVGRQGEITRMNPPAERLTGWSSVDAKGRSSADVMSLVGAPANAPVENPFERALREGSSVAIPTGTLLTRRDGTDIPIADSCAPIRSPDGQVHGAVMVFRDLTAQHLAQAEREKLHKQLVFADRMASVGTLAAGVAHEINNPLAYVAANVDIAIEEIRALSASLPPLSTADLEESLHQANEGVRRIGKIVRGLKTFSRIEEERSGVLRIGPVIDLAMNMASAEVRHRAKLEEEIGELPLVDGDEARLGQVFVNLLVNAAHAFEEGTSESSWIHVVAWTDATGKAVVEVRDNGPGISPSVLPRIFDPFFTTKRASGGTGLGLSVSHSIIAAMGGELSVESEVGRGSTFRVTLPASKSPQSPDRPTPQPHLAPFEKGTILIVDDEPPIGIALRRALRGHAVTLATSGSAALDLLDAGETFDLVLSDLMMPGMSGMDLFRNIVERHPTLAPRVVFMTGGACTSEANAFLDRIDNELLEKPFEIALLHAAIDKARRLLRRS